MLAVVVVAAVVAVVVAPLLESLATQMKVARLSTEVHLRLASQYEIKYWVRY